MSPLRGRTRERRVRYGAQVGVVVLSMALVSGAPSIGGAQPMPLLCAVTGVGAGDVLNVREAADPASLIVGTVPRCENAIALVAGPVKVAGRNWVLVQYGNIEGWVNGHYLLCPPSPQEARRVIGDQAAQFLHALQDRNMDALADFVKRGAVLSLRILIFLMTW